MGGTHHGLLPGCEADQRGKLDKEKLDAVVDFVSDKLKTNAVLGFVVKYISNNADKLQGKSAKDIMAIIEDALKTSKK